MPTARAAAAFCPRAVEWSPLRDRALHGLFANGRGGRGNSVCRGLLRSGYSSGDAGTPGTRQTAQRATRGVVWYKPNVLYNIAFVLERVPPTICGQRTSNEHHGSDVHHWRGAAIGNDLAL